MVDERIRRIYAKAYLVPSPGERSEILRKRGKKRSVIKLIVINRNREAVISS